jgi:hypothetical protein
MNIKDGNKSSDFTLTIFSDCLNLVSKKYAIFKAIHTWGNARAANAFPIWLKKKLTGASGNFHLEQEDPDTWKLFTLNNKGQQQFYQTLKRTAQY